MANKVKGKGSELWCQFSGSTWTKVASRMEITGPTMSVETTDVSDLDSSAREHEPTITDGGEVGMKLWFDPEDSTHEAMLDLMDTPVKKNWKLVFQNSAPKRNRTFAGSLTKFDHSGMLNNDFLQVDTSIKISGVITRGTES